MTPNKPDVTSTHYSMPDGNPGGGVTQGPGFTLAWQHGPRGLPDGTLGPATGAFVEHVLEAVQDRLEFFQRSRFACPENQLAIENIEAALEALNSRRRDRRERGVEGKNER